MSQESKEMEEVLSWKKEALYWREAWKRLEQNNTLLAKIIIQMELRYGTWEDVHKKVKEDNHWEVEEKVLGRPQQSNKNGSGG